MFFETRRIVPSRPPRPWGARAPRLEAHDRAVPARRGGHRLPHPQRVARPDPRSRAHAGIAVLVDLGPGANRRKQGQHGSVQEGPAAYAESARPLRHGRSAGHVRSLIPGDRKVAIAIARPTPARGQKRSRRAEAAHAWIWGETRSRGSLLDSVDRANDGMAAHRHALEAAPAESPSATTASPGKAALLSPRLRIAPTAHRGGSTRVLPLPTGRAGASQVRHRNAPRFQGRSRRR